jgi:hypothetical protein
VGFGFYGVKILNLSVFVDHLGAEGTSDGCAASGDERNRPQQRPSDDNIKKDRKDKEDIEALLPKIRLIKKT